MVVDYGLHAEPISDLFEYPETQEDWEPYILSREQVDQFQEKGYVSGIRILKDAQLEVLRSELEEMVNPEHSGREFFYEYHTNESLNPETTLFHALGAWRVRPAYHDLLWAPGFRMAAYQLLGSGFRLFHDQLFCKPTHHGSVVSWHQDFSYWTWTSPMAHLTCWIALDDATTENGCMYYVPESHKWGLVERLDLAGDMDAVRNHLNEEQIKDFEKRVPVELKAGYAPFHHPLMMHGSYENRSAKSRRATLINVFADGVISNMEIAPETQPGSDNYPKIPKGENMAGTYYPLMWEDEDLPKNLKIPQVQPVL